MLKFLISALVLAGSLFGLPNPETVFAADDGGCLTCHRYPGLVQPAKTDKIHVLHIDEKAYFQSDHGELRCIQCHTTITKVPHTGETKVDCTTQCHQGDGKLPAGFSMAGFHNQGQAYITDMTAESSCQVCHRLYPHESDPAVRAFLNMHTGFLSCEACHMKEGPKNRRTFDWTTTENVRFSGEPFGSFYDPKTKGAGKSAKALSRITGFAVENGKKSPLSDSRDLEKARQYASRGDLDGENAFFHRNVEKKEISVACNECHSTSGIMDFRKLGFSDKKARDLASINIKGLVTKYKTFYLPNLFGE